jgi:preprotein translocase subunit SecD
VTLTLPGIAGLLLSVGMAVDANILIFERMKEELRLDKPFNIALELGFGRAWDSIKDANFSNYYYFFNFNKSYGVFFFK